MVFETHIKVTVTLVLCDLTKSFDVYPGDLGLGWSLPVYEPSQVFLLEFEDGREWLGMSSSHLKPD